MATRNKNAAEETGATEEGMPTRAGATKSQVAEGPSREPATERAAPGQPVGAGLEAARIAAAAALDKKAEDVVILDVRELAGYTDYFVVASGTSDRQVSAIADSIEEQMKKAGHRPIGIEGYTRGHWVLMDFGDVVAHVFYDEARAFYDIEGLWADAARMPLE